MWRVNVGGGSSEQGDASGIPDKYERRVECFLNQDGSYNWSKQAGQQYFICAVYQHSSGMVYKKWIGFPD